MSTRKVTKRQMKSGTVDLHPSEVAAGQSSNPWETSSTPDVEGLQELTTPPIVKIADMPIGAFIDGTILDVIPSRQKSIRNPLIIVQLTKAGNKVSLPATAAIANVLLPGYDDKVDSANPAAKCPFVGSRVVCRKSGIKESKQFTEDDHKTPRKFPVFDVFVHGAAKATKGR